MWGGERSVTEEEGSGERGRWQDSLGGRVAVMAFARGNGRGRRGRSAIAFEVCFFYFSAANLLVFQVVLPFLYPDVARKLGMHRADASFKSATDRHL